MDDRLSISEIIQIASALSLLGFFCIIRVDFTTTMTTHSFDDNETKTGAGEQHHHSWQPRVIFLHHSRLYRPLLRWPELLHVVKLIVWTQTKAPVCNRWTTWSSCRTQFFLSGDGEKLLAWPEFSNPTPLKTMEHFHLNQRNAREAFQNGQRFITTEIVHNGIKDWCMQPVPSHKKSNISLFFFRVWTDFLLPFGVLLARGTLSSILYK